MNEHKYTLKNGTIVSNEYARRRIVSWLRRHDIPLEERQALARVTIKDGWYANCLVTFLCVVALETWQTSWQQQYEEQQAEEQRKLVQPPPWPEGHRAKILKSDHPNLHRGSVAYVQGDEGNYLWLIVTGGPAASLHQPIDKTSVIPVPNSPDKSPEELIEALDKDQALVGDLIDQGYILDRCLTEYDRDNWITLYEINLGDSFAILHLGVEDDVYLIDTSWPTTVTVATRL